MSPSASPACGLRCAASCRRKYRHVDAVQGVSFCIQRGEVVGLPRPQRRRQDHRAQDAGRPAAPQPGSAEVAGFVPWERSHAFLRQISMVMGNKSQMNWDIPPVDSFRVLGEIYGLSPAQYRDSLDELIALLDMRELLGRPVRTFSLGERMKCELVAGLLHQAGGAVP